ncbi:MAG: hypothetical protein JXB09_04430 [Deltaproteobacteria bacterium]|nr:hypothetical protein [Deltaproteobacteria bacterium]
MPTFFVIVPDFQAGLSAGLIYFPERKAMLTSGNKKTGRASVENARLSDFA